MRLDEKEFLTRLRTLVWRLGMLTIPGDTTAEKLRKEMKLRKEISEIYSELRNLISIAAPEYDIVTMVCEFLNYLSRYTPQLPRAEAYVDVEKAEDEKEGSE